MVLVEVQLGGREVGLGLRPIPQGEDGGGGRRGGRGVSGAFLDALKRASRPRRKSLVWASGECEFEPERAGGGGRG